MRHSRRMDIVLPQNKIYIHYRGPDSEYLTETTYYVSTCVLTYTPVETPTLITIFSFVNNAVLLPA